MSYKAKQHESGRKRNRKAQDRRRMEATERQEVSSKRSIGERIARLDKGRYAAVRERTKLAARED